ncbi:chondroitinase-B domain-containing protein [Ichthyenterobacterium sp. W332]|uniref:Chondroitinase-B domain-containing protein n=1 Tax=Microcosmobacter mediterraneus TaxID=3075607 RepID=A0ABU2YLC7_9FLAO|nr:chondroitinase-B domain-containing protein [Ichthyenterobacterium sp. W332]MDT0558852.1 chondroitinase-B domain-containing protein [Ichthyenterobacterium sp. W332]
MKNYLPVLMLLLVVNVKAQIVSNNTELENAISNAQAGTIIELANGTWTNVQLSINVSATELQPCVIKAQNPGQVFFEGRSNISIGGSYIIFEGVIFQNASGLITDDGRIEPVIEFRDTSNNDCFNCIVRNIKIDAYNGTSSQEEDVFKWVIIYGAYNEVSYSSFIGKNGVGSIINDNHNNSTPDYSKIHHNYFADRDPVDNDVNGLNDQDAIRIGVSTTSLSDSFTEVYDNFFNNWSGEVEIISNKCGSNKYYNNTFRDYQGTLTLRHGNNAEVYGNYFFGNNNAFSGGVRIIGEDHKVYNNYFEGLRYRKPNGSGSSTTGALNVMNGQVNSALNGYYQVKNVQVVNNTLVDCDLGIRVGTSLSGATLEPENLTIANNIILDSDDNAFQILTMPSGNSINEGNITQNGSWDLANGVNSNQTVMSGLLTIGSDFYRVVTGSAAIDAGVGNYPFITQDILYGDREVDFDAGAEEFGAGGSVGPYEFADVGNSLGFGAFNPLSVSDFSIDNNQIKLFPIPSKGSLTILKEHGSIGEIKLYDVQGKLLYTQNINLNKARLDISNYEAGVYILKTSKTAIRFVID